MNQATNEKPAGTRAAPRRLTKLFKVLVVGGAVIAAGYASTIKGSTGTAVHGEDDGGTKGW